MDNILLVRPNKELESQAIEYKLKHLEYGENTISGSEMWDKTDDYNAWTETITRNADKYTVNPNWVVTDTFFAIRESDNKIVGMISFRHELNDFLKDFGHSGYSIRPTERKKGYATEMLKQILGIAKQNGLKYMQLSCEKDNIPSVRTIVKNVGIYERSFEFNGEPTDIFMVTL